MKKTFAIFALAILLAIVTTGVAYAGGCIPADRCKEGDIYCYPATASNLCTEPGTRHAQRINSLTMLSTAPCEGYGDNVSIVVCKILNPENLPGVKPSEELIKMLFRIFIEPWPAR